MDDDDEDKMSWCSSPSMITVDARMYSICKGPSAWAAGRWHTGEENGYRCDGESPSGGSEGR